MARRAAQAAGVRRVSCMESLVMNLPASDKWDDGPVLLQKGDICRKLVRPDNPCEVLMVTVDCIFVIDKRTLFAEFAAPSDYEFVRRPVLMRGSSRREWGKSRGR